MPVVKRDFGKHLIKSDKNPTAENVPKTTQHFTQYHEICRHSDVARCCKKRPWLKNNTLIV